MKTINYFKLKSATKESYKTHKETVENNIQLLLIIKNLATSDQTNMLFCNTWQFNQTPKK